MIFLVINFIGSLEIHQPTIQINSQSWCPPTAEQGQKAPRGRITSVMCVWSCDPRLPRATSLRCSNYTVPLAINKSQGKRSPFDEWIPQDFDAD